ncbi:MAG: putative BRO-F [Terrestrivirus sp.]|uniref:Putative BRO-F n=1 Tax=Terrestrivirus sp. TaxID=2487775 RepID=A0A3G4ZLB8_9VIRU|nr:MAG: putative BRO-F [Terrestrivirus sp.]
MLSVFKFNDSENKINEEIEVVKHEDEIWFKGITIATILGYKNSSDALIKHVKEINKMTAIDLSNKTIAIRDSLNKFNSLTIFINEAGLYSLILKSKLKQAEQFQEWVTGTVLPSIRKTGKYDIKNDVKKNIAHKIMYDLNDYVNKSCIYILKLNDKAYKFGITENIETRFTAHKSSINFTEVIRIYVINNITACKNVETKIKKIYE